MTFEQWQRRLRWFSPHVRAGIFVRPPVRVQRPAWARLRDELIDPGFDPDDDEADG